MSSEPIIPESELDVLSHDLLNISSNLQSNDVQMVPRLTWAKHNRGIFDRALFLAEETLLPGLHAYGIPKYATLLESLDRFEVIEILTNNKEFFYEIETFAKRRLVSQCDLIHVLHMYASKYPEMQLTKTITRVLGVPSLSETFEYSNPYVVLKLKCKVITP